MQTAPPFPYIYPVSLLVLGSVLFLALVLLVVLFYQNRVLRRVISKRMKNKVTEAVYEEIDHKRVKNRYTKRAGDVLSKEHNYEDVHEELLSGEVGTENTPENYDDAISTEQTPDRLSKDNVEMYDDAIPAGEKPNITTVCTPEDYDDVTSGQGVGGDGVYGEIVEVIKESEADG
ncbi:hypothetical protein AMEX_G2960 [Astyanax mexicanus]|uniref:Uncharacterized protein n=1 Tax=Astyanax mexicanus TaxID=7994 RepID=A0A8T2M7D5_ASTMX|nr:hypothetical protein AMEX_G2960 [Astyanax mexicanus]